MKLTAAPVQLPSAACLTAPVTRFPVPGIMIPLAANDAGVPSMSNVKQSPETCPKRPFVTFGSDDTAVSR